MTTHIPTALLAGRRSTAAAAQGGSAAARPYATAAAAVAGVLALSALANHLLAKRAERRNPPSGHFIEVDGVRLHYLERGEGPPLVLLHGNGSMIEDFDSSGLIDLAARRHRVIVFDRPGFGHSTRPRETLWTADEQAGLFRAALARLGVSRALVLGHSWGASVAVALALKHPQSVSGLVLASGYYYPSARVDFAIMSGPAVPLIGAIVRYTLAPIASRLMWPLLLRKIFGPAPVPTKFDRFPKGMAVRPTQIRAAAAESGFLVPTTRTTSGEYPKLKMPMVVLAGAEDRLIDIEEQSGRLHHDISHSIFRPIAGSGHMVHQTNPEAVMAAIDEVAALADR
jgi:pimeloyl-ACP methyl ester carboxylesterase